MMKAGEKRLSLDEMRRLAPVLHVAIKNELYRAIADFRAVNNMGLAGEGRACGFVVGVVTCALLAALLYFAARWAFSGYPE